jgi:hypothetical protein
MDTFAEFVDRLEKWDDVNPGQPVIYIAAAILTLAERVAVFNEETYNWMKHGDPDAR